MFEWMPRRGPITTALGVVALAWWLVVLAVHILVFPSLPRFSPGIEGCFLTDRLVFLIECRGEWAASRWESLLFYTYWWGAGLFNMFIAPHLLLAWALSVYLAFHVLLGRRKPARGA